MPDVSSPYVVHGPKSYVDYDRPWGSRRQWLVSVQTADILTNALAVFLTLAMKSLFNILKRLVMVYWPRRASQDEAPNTTPTSPARSDASDATTRSSPLGASLSPLANSRNPASAPIDGNAGNLVHEHEAGLIHSFENNAPGERAASPAAPVGQSRDELEIMEQVEYENADSPEPWFWLALQDTRKIFQSLLPGNLRVGEEGAMQRYDLHKLWNGMANFVHDLWANLTIELAKDLGWSLGIMTLMIVIYAGTILLGVFSSAIIISDSVAISKHPGCGVFLDDRSYNNSSYRPYYNEWRKYLYDFEVECGQYAKHCYNVNNGTDGCNFFYEQSFEYSIKHNDTCPFHNDLGYLCHGGPSSAFTLSTGKVQAKALGINSPYHYAFERSTTCSPLLMDERFVRPFTQNHPNGKQYPGFRYFYGNRTGDFSCDSAGPNCTFEIRRPSIEQAAFQNTGYTISQETYDPTRTKNWQPIFKVNATAGESATLLFINNMGVFYPNERDDPVFYANELLGNTTWYFNNQLHAGVLGCMDRTIFWAPGGADPVPNLTILESNRTSLHESAVHYMLSLALVYSNLGDSIRYRKAEGLDAQAKVSSPYSLELAREQWKVEAQQLFETSLARTQLMLRNTERSRPEGPIPDEQNILPSNLTRVCSMYKFRSVGWRNVSVSHLLGIVIGAVLVLISGITTKEGPLWSEKKIRQFARSKMGQAMGSFFTWFATSIVEAVQGSSAFVGRKATAIWEATRKGCAQLTIRVPVSTPRTPLRWR